MAEYLVLQKYQGYQGTQMLFFRPGDILDDRFVDIDSLRSGGAAIIAYDPAWSPYIEAFKSALNQGNNWEVITAYFLAYGLIGGGGSSTVVKLPAGEPITAGDVLAVNSAGDIVKSSTVFSAGLFNVVGISDVSVGVGELVSVVTEGNIQTTFDAPPSASSNGSLAYLSTTAGKATLSPASTPGRVVLSIGVLQGADGATSSPLVLFHPQYISRLP